MLLKANNPWKYHKYVVPIDLIREEDGRFSAIAPNLPGVASFGDTKEQAVDHVIEAMQGALEAYGSDSIPWTEPGPPDADAERRRIVVDAPTSEWRHR